MFKSYSMFYVETVYVNADSRFAFQSRKSQVSNSENTGYIQEEPKSKVQKQAELREKGNSSEKAWTKLGLKFLFFSLNIPEHVRT
jgi:hypothetical protein